MKNHTAPSRRARKRRPSAQLAAAILTLHSAEEVPHLLPRPVHAGGTAGDGRPLGGGRAACSRGLPYREIHRQTGVSVTTIGRVARYLAAGQRRLRAVAAAALGTRGRHGSRRQPRLQARRAEVRPAHRHLARPADAAAASSSQRGKDQLMGFGENMPLDVLFVRDDDIPDLVQEDVCDLGLVGLNVLEEKRLELAARGGAARCSRRCARSISAAAGCRSPCPTASQYRGPPSLRGQAHRDHLPVHARPLPRAQHGIERRDRHALGRRRDRAAARPRRPDLRSRLHRLDAAANHLREVETVLESHAVLIRTPVPLPPRSTTGSSGC